MPGARDGQLRVRRGTDGPPWALQMFDDDLGLWLTLCQADEEDEMVRAGIPILRGPYVADYTDFATEGAVKTLWIPQEGDILLRLFYDWQASIPWAYTGGIGGTYGEFYVGQNPAITGGTPRNTFGGPMPSDLSYQLDPAFNGQMNDAAGTTHYDTAYVFHSADPVQLLLAQTQLINSPPGTPTAGHLEVYALVARAVAP